MSFPGHEYVTALPPGRWLENIRDAIPYPRAPGNAEY